MIVRLIIDEAGRVAIPKPWREELRLEAGDAMEMESAGDEITLRPLRGAGLTKERSVWVLHASQSLPASVTDDLLREIREARDFWQISATWNQGLLDTSERVPVFYGDHVHQKASL